MIKSLKSLVYKLKPLTPILLMLLTIIVLSPLSYSQSEYIESFYSEIKIHGTGGIDVTETIKYNFGNSHRHGIYRNIDIKKENKDGKKFVLETEVLRITDEHGNVYSYTQEKEGDYLKLKIGDPNNTITGTHTYIISYKVLGALTYFSDHDELYWNINGTEWEVPIKSIETKVVVPETINQSDISSTCYKGVYGSTLQDCSTYVESNYVYANSKAVLPSGENLSIVVSFPKGFVEEVEAKRDYSNIFYTLLVIVLGIIGIFWYLYLPIKVFSKWFKDYKNTKSKERIVAAWFSPPKNNNSNFTPAETGLLIDKITDHKEVSATIIHLAQRGYLKIVQESKKQFKLIKTKEYSQDSELKTYEKTLLSGIFAKGDEVNLKNLKTPGFYQRLQSFQKQLEEDVMKMSIFEQKPSKIANNQTVLGILGICFLNPILTIICLIFGRKSAARTNYGIEKYSEAKSLLNFLKSQDEQLDFQSKNQMFFEKLLPYATVFGVEDIWAKRFKDLEFKNTGWYDGNLNNTIAFSLFTNNFSNSVRTITGPTSTTSSSGFGSGFSSGSGFSGGGGGGGGGGSW